MIEGSLRNVPLADVFQVVATSHKSGALSIARGRHRARVHFDEGRIRYAHLNTGVNLGEILVRMDLLTVSELLTLLVQQERESAGLPLGLAAVEAGYIDAAGLKAGLERQVLEVLGELLSWRSGTFSFGEGTAKAEKLGSAPALDAMMLLMEVVRHAPEEGAPTIDPTTVFRQAGDPTKVELPAGGWEILATVDGRRHAASIAAESEVPERQVYALLGSLQRLGVIEPSPFPVEIPEVLLLTPSNAHGRLLRLLLARCRALPRVESTAPEALAYLETSRPRALVVDDHDGTGWQFLREARRLRGKGHLPAVVLTPPGQQPGVLAKARRPRALTLPKPFRELEFQQLLMRMVG